MSNRYTPTQRQVAELICQDPPMTAPEIARTLGMALLTVRTHVRDIANRIDNPNGLPAMRLIRVAAGLEPAPPRPDMTNYPRRCRMGVSPQMRARIFERDNFRCRRCGHQPPDVKLMVDHIWPVSMGGDTEERNLQTLCEDCNAGKGGNPPHPHDLRPADDSVSMKQNPHLS